MASSWTNLGYTSGSLSFAPLGTSAPTSLTASSKSPAVSEFAGLPFDLALGEVYGLRVWKIDEYGRLRARNWDKARPWKPGVNVAKCHAEGGSIAGIIDPTGKGRKVVDVTIEQSYSGPSTYRIKWSDGTNEVTSSVEFAPTTHAVPDENCACGFYAYSDPKHEETGTRNYARGGFVFMYGTMTTPAAPPRYVLGVIKGTGRTLIGTKGFRCEKAEIVALRDPMRGGKKQAEWREEQSEKLRRVYPDIPLLGSRAELLEFAPVQAALPEPGTDEFWALP